MNTDEDMNEETADNWEATKIIFVGDGAVGKTSILTRFQTGGIDPEHVPTIVGMVTLKMKDITVPEDVTLTDGTQYRLDMEGLRAGESIDMNLHVFDTPGQIEFERLRRLQYSKARLFVMVCSIDKPNSLLTLKTAWNKEIENASKYVPKILVANKEDVRDDPRIIKDLHENGMDMVTREQIQKAAMELGAIDHIFVSALTGYKINECMKMIAEKSLLRRRERRGIFRCTLF